MKAVIQWVLRTMMRDQTGVMRTLPRKDIFDFNVAMTAERLMRNGIDPNSLKNANQVENAIKMIDDRPSETMSIGEARGSGIKSAKIMDMEGKEIDPRSRIMGGKQAETDAEIKARLDKDNKEGLARIRAKQKRVEDAIDNMSPSLSGDTRTDAALVAEDIAESMGKVYDDLSSREQLDLYDEAYTALSKKRFKGMKKPKDADDPNYDTEPADFDPDADNETFAQGGRAGFFMGGPNPRGLGLLRQLLNFFGKKSDMIRNPSDTLKIVNPKAFNKMLEDAKGKMIPKEGIMATDAIKDYQTQMAKDRIEMVKDMIERGKRFKGADDKILTYKNDVKERFIKDLQMSEADAEIAADRMVTLAMDVTKMPKTPKITEEGILQLENVIKNMETGGKKKRDLNADGGRIGFKDGMSRRTFLKIFGGLVSLPIIGKVLAPLKLTKGVSKVPIIKTDNVPGKPEWFDQLVNKVIVEGDDVTKRFATGERQSIHQKTLDDGSVVRVTEDVDDGAVRVEYESEANVFGDDVQLQYRKELPDQSNPNPTAEFTTAESGPVGRQTGPDDFDIDVDEVGGTSIRDLDSDVSKLKEYATGKKPTMTEIVQNKKRRDKAKAISEDMEAQSDAVIRRQGEMLDDQDFASGGIARMLGE